MRADHVAADLADPAQRDALAEEVAQGGREVDVLVNCAGFGIYGPFVSNERERELQQVRLLVEAVVDLTSRYLPGMVQRDSGAVINVSSTAGIQPLPHKRQPAAAASRHVDSLGDPADQRPGDRRDGRDGASGPVRSGFQDASDAGHFADRMPEIVFASPERVAEDALAAAERGKRSVVPGGLPVRASLRGPAMSPGGWSWPCRSG